MGADLEAILFYGFPLPTLVANYYELNVAWEKDHRPAEPEDESDYKTPEWDEWHKRLREWEASLENVRIGWSGAEECERCCYVHCSGFRKSVEWAELLLVSPHDLDHLQGAKVVLHEFCDRFNIPKAEPGWYLAARYF